VLVKTLTIQPKQIIKKVKVEQTTYFVRDASTLFRRTAELLAEIRYEKFNRRTSDANLNAWILEIKKLAKELDPPPPPALRILNVMKWYRDHYDDDEFIPRVETGRWLSEKFERLEEAMRRRVKLRNGHDEDLTPEEILRQSGFSSSRLIESMIVDIIKPTKKLKLIDIDRDAVLTSHLVELYNAIREQRSDADLTSDLKVRLGGPLEILKQYIDWLSEKDWEASSRVLKFDSPAFSQFRRDFRGLEGLDPINGVDRYE
jgi:hypothetical protein